MRIKLTYLALFIGIVLTGSLCGQTTHLAGQFLLNPWQTNPAMTGVRQGTAFWLTARQQWLGIQGAPATQTFSVVSSLKDRQSRFNPKGFINRGVNSFSEVGLGGGIFNFSYGAINHTGIHFEYAYHVFLGKGRLGLGLAPLYHQFIINKSGFILPDGDAPDNLISGKTIEVLHFLDANFGLHYSLQNFHAGFSVIQLLNSKVFFGDLSFDSQDDPFNNPYLARTISAYTGYAWEAGKAFTAEPSILVIHNGSRGIGAQANVLFTIAENYQAGISWRFRESVAFMAGIQLSDFMFRYLFESPAGSQIPQRFNSHQVLVGYRLTDR